MQIVDGSGPDPASGLANLGQEWRIAFDPNNPAVLDGEVAGSGNDRKVEAPMYVSVQIPPDGNYHYCVNKNIK